MEKAPDVSSDEVAERIESVGKEALLLKDVFGSEVKGPDGETIATVVPGGRLVPAILKTREGDSDRLVVPFQAVKLSKASGKVQATPSLKLSELRDRKEMRRLKEIVPDGSD